MGDDVEGITATQCAFELSQKLNVECPLPPRFTGSSREGLPPGRAIANLMGRPQRHELEDAYLTL